MPFFGRRYFGAWLESWGGSWGDSFGPSEPVQEAGGHIPWWWPHYYARLLHRRVDAEARGDTVTAFAELYPGDATGTSTASGQTVTAFTHLIAGRASGAASAMVSDVLVVTTAIGRRLQRNSDDEIAAMVAALLLHGDLQDHCRQSVGRRIRDGAEVLVATTAIGRRLQRSRDDEIVATIAGLLLTAARRLGNAHRPN